MISGKILLSNRLMKKNPINFILISVWLIAISTGLYFLYQYQNKNGELGTSSSHWIESSNIHFEENKNNVLMFLHPYCPCSRASLNELAKILSHKIKPSTVKIILAKPESKDSNWVYESPLYKITKELNFQSLIDKNSHESKLFEAKTSGLVLIFNKDKKLMFRGGITDSRGHEGDNKGAQKALTILQSISSQSLEEFFVFGCEIY